MVRTRIAPSPTGYAHIGTIYQALFNYAYAKKHTGAFIVRIEDTDRQRLVDDAEKFIFESLDWVGLSENESPRKGGEFGPYRQSERLSIYHTHVEELISNGHAYYSYFPREDAGQKKDYSKGRTDESFVSEDAPPESIEEMIKRGDWIVRMRVPKDETITVRDEIRGEISFPSSEVTEQVLLKSDGFPTYHLAVVVDDHLMKISHILRAEEWLSSLPKHMLLYRYFGWEMPPIFHTATLRNPDKSKLSKRHGHTNVLWYKEEGYLPEAILNYLAHLGWTHPDEKEIFSLEEFIEKFDLKDIRPVAAVFDLTKLTWMNQHYIQSLSDSELKSRLLMFYGEDLKDDELLEKIVPLVKSRMKTLKDFFDLTAHFHSSFTLPQLSDEQTQIVVSLSEQLEKVASWDRDGIFSAFQIVMEEQKIRMPMLYYLLTGSERGLPLPESLEILGKEKTLTRLKSLK